MAGPDGYSLGMGTLPNQGFLIGLGELHEPFITAIWMTTTNDCDRIGAWLRKLNFRTLS